MMDCFCQNLGVATFSVFVRNLTGILKKLHQMCKPQGLLTNTVAFKAKQIEMQAFQKGLKVTIIN